jgi:hypothetical protein
MREKKTTSTRSTSSISVADRGPGGSQLGRASYRGIQTRDAVIIFAFGVHPTPGYVDFFEQSPIDIFPPQFIFRTIPPSGMVPMVLTPFSIWVMFGATEQIKTVTVHDADGEHDVEVEQLSQEAAAAQQPTWVSGSVVGQGTTAAAMFGRATTMATGEEGGGPTTMATGEEDITAPTTMATGEEGPGPTTMATGEEETRIATTLAVGEEDPTTLAVGEEGPTTQMLGEEGPTTLAFGEETPRLTPFGMF